MERPAKCGLVKSEKSAKVTTSATFETLHKGRGNKGRLLEKPARCTAELITSLPMTACLTAAATLLSVSNLGKVSSTHAMPRPIESKD
jgi:hypothetical protein